MAQEECQVSMLILTRIDTGVSWRWIEDDGHMNVSKECIGWFTSGIRGIVEGINIINKRN